MSTPIGDWRRTSDGLCSLHLYMRGYDESTPASLSEFLRERVNEVSRVRSWAGEVLACLAVDGVKRLAFEEMVDDPERTLRRLSRELSIEPRIREPLLPLPVGGPWGSRWHRLFSTRPDSTSIPAGRVGRVRSWREAFRPEDRAFFRDEAGDLLIELGYERSDDWVKGLFA